VALCKTVYALFSKYFSVKNNVFLSHSNSVNMFPASRFLQEPMRDPHVAADGFTYEGDAIRGWLDGGNDASPVTGQPLAHRELAPNLALGAVIQDYTMMKRRQHRFGDSHDTVAALQFFSSPVGSER